MVALCCPVACAEGCETHGACDNGTCNCGMGWGGNDCLTGKSVEHEMKSLSGLPLINRCLSK